MKDDGYIAIASPDKVVKLNKAEFAEYLENYWKQVTKWLKEIFLQVQLILIYKKQ